MTSKASGNDRFDVVVVGARCAGSPLATMLTRRGFKVCVLDRGQFPSETPSTHLIQPCGVQMLDRLGVLNAVLEAGAVPLDQITFANDDVRFDLINDGTLEWPALIVRRVTLDALLVDAAREAGADVRTGCRVTRLLMDGDRVAGVETDAGPIHAQLVVGADGRHSTVASLVGAAEYHVTPPGRVTVWAYYAGVANREGRMWLGRVGELAYLAGPTDSDLFMAAITTGFANQAEFHADRDANFTAAIRAWPELSEAIGGGHRVGPIRVLTKWHGYFRQAAGPGWVLVGDAGHFKDPMPGQGISDAFRQAEQLAQAIEDGRDNNTIDASMHRWWRWRDDDAYAMYWFASDLGAPGAPTPLNTALSRHMRDNPEAPLMFLRLLNRDISPSEFLTPSRLARIAARALLDRPDRAFAAIKEIARTGRRNVRRSRQKRVDWHHQGATPTAPGINTRAMN